MADLYSFSLSSYNVTLAGDFGCEVSAHMLTVTVAPHHYFELTSLDGSGNASLERLHALGGWASLTWPRMGSKFNPYELFHRHSQIKKWRKTLPQTFSLDFNEFLVQNGLWDGMSPVLDKFEQPMSNAVVMLRLRQRCPGLLADVVHPVVTEHMALKDAVISLNDKFRWSREKIADWMETLDVDLSFRDIP